MEAGCCFYRQMLGYCSNPLKMKKGFVPLLFKECFTHRFLRWSAEHCKVLPFSKALSKGSGGSTWVSLCCQRRVLQEEGPAEAPGSSSPGKAEHSLPGTRQPGPDPALQPGCSWNSSDPSLPASSASSAPARNTSDLENGLKLHIAVQRVLLLFCLFEGRSRKGHYMVEKQKNTFSWAIAILICITLHTQYIYIWNLLLLRKCFFNEEDLTILKRENVQTNVNLQQK